jgi:hypothetical protein
MLVGTAVVLYNGMEPLADTPGRPSRTGRGYPPH